MKPSISDTDESTVYGMIRRPFLYVHFSKEEPAGLRVHILGPPFLFCKWPFTASERLRDTICRALVDQAGNGLFSSFSSTDFHPSDDGSSFSDDDNDDIDDNDGFWGNES